MAFLVSTLYSVFLGTLSRNFIQVQVTDPDSRIVVRTLICGSNWLRTIPLLLVFLVDWVVFVVVFPPSTSFSVERTELALLFLYVPALCLLGVSVVLSLEDSLRFCTYAAWYHWLGAIAECVWLTFRVRDMATLSGADAGLVFGGAFVYFGVRVFVGGSYWWAHQKKGLRGEVLGFVALVAKPSMLLLATRIPEVTALGLGGR